MKYLLFVLIMSFVACTDYSQNFEDGYGYGKSGKGVEFDGSSLKDLRDNHVYGVAQVEDLYWMMDDLAYEFYNDERYGSTFCPRSKSSMCESIGFFYPGGHLDNVCPNGWRLPSSKEWWSFYHSVAFRSRSYDSDFYKGVYGGDGSLSNENDFAFFWVYDTLDNKLHRDCVKISKDNGFVIDQNQRCDTEWKISVRCVKDVE